MNVFRKLISKQVPNRDAPSPRETPTNQNPPNQRVLVVIAGFSITLNCFHISRVVLTDDVLEVVVWFGCPRAVEKLSWRLQ